jgi:nucleotide-binding universal stress UspA family protein
MKILIAADGSDYTRRMLDYLAAHEWLRSGHTLRVLTVVLPLPHRAAAFAGSDLARTYYVDDAEQVLRPLREFMKTHGVDAEFDYRIGQPAERIAGAAVDGAHDLVVMGSHGHGAVASLVLGSVAMKVVAACKIPVLLVR